MIEIIILAYEVVTGGLMVRVQHSTLSSTFFSILVSLFMGSLSLQTIVNTWQRFYLFF